MIRLGMKICNMKLKEKQQKYQHYNSGKLINMSIYVTVEEILQLDQRRVIRQTNFSYSPLGKALEKQTKTIQHQYKKQIKAIEYNWLKK